MSENKCNCNPPNSISRRNFFGRVGLISAGLVMPKMVLEAATYAEKQKVAVARAKSYSYEFLRAKIEAMFDAIGGISDVVKPGDKVGLKINLTGGKVMAEKSITQYGGLHAKDTFWTHPTVVRVVSELLKDAGAGQIYFMEASYDGLQSFEYGGFNEVANRVGATLIDLNDKYPYNDWVVRNVEPAYRWNSFKLNGLLSEIDVFVSIPKLKQHLNAGVTHAMKNLIGIVPLGVPEYSLGAGNRKGLHRDENGNACPDCLCKAVIDLNIARPVNLAVVDGITSCQGSEGTWGGGFTPVSPGLLVAGKNAVSTDAVCTALMGYNTEAADYTQPFFKSVNYLRLAGDERQLGPYRLSDIEIMGPSITSVTFPFQTLGTAPTAFSKETLLTPYAGVLEKPFKVYPK